MIQTSATKEQPQSWTISVPSNIRSGPEERSDPCEFTCTHSTAETTERKCFGKVPCTPLQLARQDAQHEIIVHAKVDTCCSHPGERAMTKSHNSVNQAKDWKAPFPSLAPNIKLEIKPTLNDLSGQRPKTPVTSATAVLTATAQSRHKPVMLSTHNQPEPNPFTNPRNAA
eukprot:TRINITY_DN5548_c1_g1_i1.p1 TRINITY_DN5548_c1_g1~~TRINITY_DN5548_c1_g1_i1.p1  ORF type:complete len:170 (-),score=7.83 TRINITY_DN5548_c1_g1_i1:389-898(-)